MDKVLSTGSKNQSSQVEIINRQRAFWGTIALDGILLMVMTYFLTTVFRQPEKTIIIFIAAALIMAAIAAVVTSLVLTIRKRQEAGLAITLRTLSVFGVLITTVLQGRTPVASVSILAVSAMAIVWLVPRRSQKQFWIGLVTAIALMWVIEWFNPVWRIQSAAAQVGPAAAVIFAFLLAGTFLRQAWGGNIRLKIVTSFTVIALVSVAIVGTIVYISYRNQVRQDIRQRLINIAEITATQVDADLHAAIQSPEDMTAEPYQKLQAQSRKIISTDPDLKYIYTMRANDQGQIYFIIDARQASDPEIVDVGTVYEEPSDLLLSNIKTLNAPVAEQDIYTDEYGSVLSAYAPVFRSDGTLEAILGVDISADKVVAEERSVLFLILGTTLATMLGVTLFGLWLGGVFTGPIIDLSKVAHRVIEGDLNARVEIRTSDEVGELAKDFNLMTSQLQETLQGLEQRVTERTRNLELAAEVGHTVSQVRELDVMLKDACELILKEFNLYYVQVYLTDASASTLKLEAGTGSVGAQLIERGHSLPLDSSSINGRAATEKRSVVISDTTRSATFRPNQLLPETRGEMAVPLIVADKVVGVLDMQSNKPGVLNTEVLPAFEALAGQLAVAIQNANLLAEGEQARALVEAQARHLVRQGWSEHLDAIHKPEQLGYVFDHNKVAPLADEDETQLPGDGKTVSAPIAVTGETLGSLMVELTDESRRKQTGELVEIVARQVAQQVENLRLLESAERYRSEVEKAARLQTIEGWQKFVETKNVEKLGYIYNTNEVLPHGDGQDKDASMFALPIKARDETIGKLAVEGLTPDDQESVDLMNTVAERLSAHIENLRLFEQTQVSLAETQSLYRINEAISGEMDMENIYQAVARLSCDEMGFSGSWISIYEPETDTLRGVAGVNIPEDRLYASLPLSQNTPATLAAKARHLVTVNDPAQDERMADLPPTVRAMMGKALSTPVMIGQELLGVIAATRNENAADIGVREERMLQAVATQLAIVMQRVKLFEQLQKQAKRETMLNVINQKIQSATSVEAVLQIAARELGHALGAPMTIAQLSMKDKSS